MNEVITFGAAFYFIINAIIILLAVGLVLLVVWALIKMLCILAGWLEALSEHFFKTREERDE